MSLVEIAFLTLFHACKKFAGLKIISENNFRGLRCNEVPGICRTNSLSKQGFDSGKHQNVFPHSTVIISEIPLKIVTDIEEFRNIKCDDIFGCNRTN